MRVLITGTSNGIGKAIALKFLAEGHEVIGFDIQAATIFDKNYIHQVCDVRKPKTFKRIDNIDILINNAGVQNQDDIDVNLKGAINVTERYGIDNDNIKSILFIGSASAHTGAEFPEYCASKGGLLAYSKNVALRIAKYGATCNSLDPGGVLTDLNKCVIEDQNLWNQIMELTPLKKWADAAEIAEWAYFLTVVNTFCTAQNILVDGGESANNKFIWKSE